MTVMTRNRLFINSLHLEGSYVAISTRKYDNLPIWKKDSLITLTTRIHYVGYGDIIARYYFNDILVDTSNIELSSGTRVSWDNYIKLYGKSNERYILEVRLFTISNELLTRTQLRGILQ